MKDTTPHSPWFNAQFSCGALSRKADSDAARHGCEMDAPGFLPAGCWENDAPCDAYYRRRQSVVAR